MSKTQNSLLIMTFLALMSISNYSSSDPKTNKDNHYLDNGNNTITDTNTNLMWKKCSEGLSGNNCEVGEARKYLWSDATSKFNIGSTGFAGYDDWRLPTDKELESLIYCSNGTPREDLSKWGCEGKDFKYGKFQTPAIDLKFFPNTDRFAWFHSSVTDAIYHSDSLNLSIGRGGILLADKKYPAQVRLVREIK